MAHKISILEAAAINLTKFANSIPEAIIAADYISWEDRNKIWDSIVMFMPPQAQNQYRERMREILMGDGD